MVGELHVFKRNVLLLTIVFLACLVISYTLAGQNLSIVAGAVVGVGLFIFGFLSPKIALYLLIFSMLLSPEIGSRDYTGQGFTIRFEDLLLVIMCFTWFAKSSIKKDVGLAVKTSLNIPILFYLIACIIATLLGIIDGSVTYPITAILFVVKYFEYFVIYFLTVNYIQSKSEIKNLLIAVFITYFIVLIYSLAQIPQGGRITTPFEGGAGEANTLGGYLVIMFSLNAVLFFNVEKTSHRVFLAILAFSNFLALLHTLSRASWLAFLTVYMMLIILVKKRNFLIFGIVVGLIFAPIMLPKIVIDRTLYTFGIASEEVTSQQKYIDEKMKQYMALSEQQKKQASKYVEGMGINVDSSTAARLNSMKNVIRDFPKRPIFGYGVKGYEFLDAQLPLILIETGLVGLFSFIYLLWVVGKSLLSIWKKYRTDPLYNTLSSGTLCAFFGLVVHSVGTNTFIIVRIMEPFWCLMGLNMAILLIEKEEIQNTKSPVLEEKKRNI